ncbi:RNA deprotection pyrophosphohydrolase [Oceanobacillus indicireducens]|uniref:Nucleoside triphosphatase YtkD n=1 Tax=Oceanobacillus indicireducens TaxID=1004261 RepID=A0A918D556_9BACI|nr:nucleoside triphosphatase YtkD [Oceanobacillus indicireducens]GGN65847.1 nucleoside triphosphatase YtkD [Oceanobacillus indicireducens]
MITFRDFYNNKVQLSFQDHPFSKEPKHVLVICKHREKWLLTKHKERGLEFPGGKVEPGESADDAAVREVLEETGGVVTNLHYIGQYFVDGKKDYVIKNLYFAEVKELKEQPTYFETDGPVLLLKIPENVNFNSSYSFIMKDRVIEHAMEYIEKYFE